MKIAKRIVLFMSVNILIVVTLSVTLSLLGITPYLNQKGLDLQQLMLFCLVWGFGGAFISLAMSRQMAKWMMGVEIIPDNTQDLQLRSVRDRVYAFSRQAGLTVMPEVGVYDSPEINAFATGPTKNKSLVAVSTGLLQNMNAAEVDGVLAHEVAHIANGDMVTMTLIQGVVNALVMFLARVAAYFASQLVDEEKRSIVQLFATLALEIVLGILGMILVSYVSRHREFRADAGGARLAGRDSMVMALQKLKANLQIESEDTTMATLKISGRAKSIANLFSTHPDLDVRIAKLMEARDVSIGTR